MIVRLFLVRKDGLKPTDVEVLRLNTYRCVWFFVSGAETKGSQPFGTRTILGLPEFPLVVLLFLQRNRWILDRVFWAAPHVRLVTAGWMAYAYFNPNGLQAIGDGMQCLCHFATRPTWNLRVPWRGQLGRSLFGQFEKRIKTVWV